MSECDCGIVVRQLTCRGALRSERNAVVDVENTGGAAWRPDSSGRLDFVGFGVDLASQKIAAAAEARLRRGLLHCQCG